MSETKKKYIVKKGDLVLHKETINSTWNIWYGIALENIEYDVLEQYSRKMLWVMQFIVRTGSAHVTNIKPIATYDVWKLNDCKVIRKGYILSGKEEEFGVEGLKAALWDRMSSGVN